MAKNRIEGASDAWANPPHPGDPTSAVTRQDHAVGGTGSSGEALHKPPMDGAVRDEETGRWRSPGDLENDARDAAELAGGEFTPGDDRPSTKDAGAAVPSSTGLDANHSGREGTEAVSEVDSDEYRDDPMPDRADERVDWAERGDGPVRARAALHAENNRPGGQRSTVVRRLEALINERGNQVITPDNG
jgi:hypothetical protein